MTLLEDIQTAAVDASNDVGTLLRKCKLLAARLQSQPLEDWVIWESNGYPENIKVPDYRIWPLEVKGHFSGAFGSGIRNAPIPLVCLPEKARKDYERYECRLSIAGVEASLEQTDVGLLQVATGNLALILGMKVYRNQNCVHAWAEFEAGNLVELLNGVRNRILDFALAIWKEEPTAGDVNPAASATLKSAHVTQIFNTHVLGGTANLVGTAIDSTIAFSITAHDFSSLENCLRERGVEDEDIQDLNLAIQSDSEPESKEKFGPKVSAWFAKMMQKAADGSWGIGVGTASNLLTRAIVGFYGL